MSTAVATQASNDNAALMEKILVGGDLSSLTSEERVRYYDEVCRSLGLSPLSRPFEYIVLNDKLTLYARKDAADQLRRLHNVSLVIVSREIIEGVYVVTARAQMSDGRTDESTGAVPIVRAGGDWKTSGNGKRYFAADGTFTPLPPDERANALMRAETKAKRRVTLSICGLGWLDESEIESIPSARGIRVDGSGNIAHHGAAQQSRSAHTENDTLESVLATIKKEAHDQGLVPGRGGQALNELAGDFDYGPALGRETDLTLEWARGLLAAMRARGENDLREQLQTIDDMDMLTDFIEHCLARGYRDVAAEAETRLHDSALSMEKEVAATS